MDIDIFNLVYTEPEQPQISKDEYITKSKNIFIDIFNSYGSCWYDKRLTDEDYNKCNCDNCLGNCTLTIEDKLYQVSPNHEYGDCFVRVFNKEEFVSNIEDMFFNDDSDYLLLLNSKIKNE